VSNALVSEFPILAVPAPMQAKLSETHTLPCHANAELFCSILLHGGSTVSSRVYFAVSTKFYLLFTPTRLWQNQISAGVPQGHAK